MAGITKAERERRLNAAGITTGPTVSTPPDPNATGEVMGIVTGIDHAAKTITVSRPEDVDFIVGLRKVAPNTYRAIKGKLVDGKVVELVVDQIAEPLQYVAATVSSVLAKMVQSGEIP